MSYEEFQAFYEQESERHFQKLIRCSEAELLDRIARKEWESNYQIWQALAKVGTAKSIAPLFALVGDPEVEYLVRYHACNALFSLAGIDDEDLKGRVQYGLDQHRQPADQHAAIRQLGQMLGITAK